MSDDKAITLFDQAQEYPWAVDDEERRRAFVFDRFGGEVGIETMEKYVQWLKNGKVSTTAKLMPVS